MINLNIATINRNVNVTKTINITHKISKTETPRIIIYVKSKGFP